MTKLCRHCGGAFNAHHAISIYCSRPCQYAARAEMRAAEHALADERAAGSGIGSTITARIPEPRRCACEGSGTPSPWHCSAPNCGRWKPSAQAFCASCGGLGVAPAVARTVTRYGAFGQRDDAARELAEFWQGVGA